MSIFKVKPWWSNDKLQDNEAREGIQNFNCIKVDKFSSHNDSDCIIIGEGTLLKIYKPNIDQNVSYIILETELSDVVLHIETGKFVTGTEDRQLLILHPQSYAIYQLNRKEGHTDAGDQNFLAPVIKHSFTRKAYNMTCGSFGSVKTRDFICIQALDGSLSFFDQDTFLFMCIFGDVIIPGPVSYIASSDAFVICKSTWVLEIYSYQQLREFSELNVRQNKKNTPQWLYNAGEEVSSVQVIQTSSNFSSIIALGERNIYCFQDNGLMKYMIKFDYMPICFYAYLIGWFYEPGARLLVTVASEDSKMFIYEDTTLLWSCDLVHTVISISRCFLKSLPGGIVTLSTNGIVSVSYIGTEPDLNANVAPAMNDVADPQQVQADLEIVEDSLRKIMNNTEDASPIIDQIIQIKADVGKPVQNLFQQFTNDTDAALHLLMCPVVVMITCTEPALIQSIQVTYVCCQPFTCSEPTVCLESINGTEIIETQVIISSEADISETNVKVLLTVTDTNGKIIVLQRKVLLPLSLYCLPSAAAVENDLKLTIQANRPGLNLTELLTDFMKEELTKHGSVDIVTFEYRTTKKTVTLKSSGKQYTVEANEPSEIASILDHLIHKLREHYARVGEKDFSYNLQFEDELLKQLTHKFLKSIESHAKKRIELKTFEDEMNILQRQFTVIQKKLLVQYGSSPPGDCDLLEFLMKDTHRRLIESVKEVIRCKEIVCRASSNLSAIGYLIVRILKEKSTDDFKVKLIEEMLSLSSIYEDYQEWEETVTQGTSYILNNAFKKSEKDKEKLAPVTEQGILSHVNLKRFIKQIKLILDRLFMEFRNDDLEKDSVAKQNKITRIEEFVEVL